MNNCNNRTKFYNARFKTRQLRPIGKGRQGIVFVVSERSNGSHPFAMKIVPFDLAANSRREPQPSEVEFNNQKAAYNAARNGVVNIMKLIKCKNFINSDMINMPNVQNSRSYNKSKQSVIYMEYCSGGDLTDWLSKKKTLNDDVMRHIISSILRTLYKIQKKYPYFRHNDLHLKNVFVADRGFLIGDFGWSRLLENGTNPAVNTANRTKTASYWGVGPRTDIRYDQHLFLNNMLMWIKDNKGQTRFPKTMAFLNAALPDGYRGEKSAYVNESRLIYGKTYPGLPSLFKLLHNRYITSHPITPLNLMNARSRLRKMRVLKRKTISPVRVRSLTLKKRKATPKLRGGSAPSRLATGKKLFKPRKLLPVVVAKRTAPPPRPIVRVNRRISPVKLNSNYEKSPASGRLKIQGPSGRMVYANGSAITISYLLELARRRRVNVSGISNKRALVSKIFRV
jgi:hypothetical protein